MSIEHLFTLGNALIDHWRVSKRKEVILPCPLNTSEEESTNSINASVPQNTLRARRTHFDDLPDELLLMICRYLTSVHMLKAFHTYNNRISSCISEYEQTVHLIRCSLAELTYFFQSFVDGHFCPTTIFVTNNGLIPTQINIFQETYISKAKISFPDLRHLWLIGCTRNDLAKIKFCLDKFQSLESLRIIEKISDESLPFSSYDTINKLYECLSYQFIRLELSTNNGTVLHKRMSSNEHLKHLIISLQTVDDLFVLFDGLTPNLVTLNVSILELDTRKRSSIPQNRSDRLMSHLVEVRLQTKENVEITLDHFRGIVMPLINLEIFKIDIHNWTSDDLRGNEIEMLINQFMPRLRHFHCSIQTIHSVDMQTFATLSKRWPIACSSAFDSWYKHLYTVPWSFKHLHSSMLAEDDTQSICPDVQCLTVEMPGMLNLSRRFPNVYTLNVLSPSDLTYPAVLEFRRLQCLTVNSMQMISAPLRRCVYTLRFAQAFEPLSKPIIYPHVKYLILCNDQIESVAKVTALVQCFPNLQSIKLELNTNDTYYDCLNILLDSRNLSNLALLKVNWIDKDKHIPDIIVWLSANTILRWRSTPFDAFCDQSSLTICL